VSVLKELLDANAKYAAEFGDKANLATPPARRVAIVTCMDARLDPVRFFGLSEGDAHIIRNAGGRASEDAIRSLVISYKLMGTKEFFVIHHTECGSLTFTNAIMGDLLASSLETVQLTPSGYKDVGKGPGSPAGRSIDWLTFSDQNQAVLDDVAAIRNHPLVPKTIPVYGYIFDVKTGKLAEVEGAKALGAVGK
jgi:carbonic anhydrase